MSAPIILEVQSLEVKYRFQKAVKGVSFSLLEGESLGLLGANGAGKTSTIRALLAMLPYQGKIGLFGGEEKTWKVFQHLGYAPEDSVPPEFLTGREYLKFISGFRVGEASKRNEEVEKWLSLFELPGEKKIRDYSKGMKRKVVLAQAFLGAPKLLILDEPLNGLDPLMIIRLRDVILDFRKQGTLIYSSHILSEVEKSCSRVLVLNQGEKVLDQTVPNILGEFGSVEAAFARYAQRGA